MIGGEGRRSSTGMMPNPHGRGTIQPWACMGPAIDIRTSEQRLARKNGRMIGSTVVCVGDVTTVSTCTWHRCCLSRAPSSRERPMTDRIDKAEQSNPDAGNAAERPRVNDEPLNREEQDTGAGQEARRGVPPGEHDREHQSNYGGGGENGG